jgi:hypothetical protein
LKLNLLPYPRRLVRLPGFYTIPSRAGINIDPALPQATAKLLFERLSAATEKLGVTLTLEPPPSPGRSAPAARTQDRLSRRHKSPAPVQTQDAGPVINIVRSELAPDHAEAYILRIESIGITVFFRDAGGLRACAATLRQLLREYGRRLPRLVIRDFPDFDRRGVMLDVSRGRVPKLQTLLDLVDHLADFKINELQLYTEHTFAYRRYEAVWKSWGALTGEEITRLDARCRELGIDLVPNQNSFGHLRQWLEHAPLKRLAETAEPYEVNEGSFLRYPSTLAPNHPGTLPFLRELYDELLPNFTSKRFNVGCDETWDLGQGQSKRLCETKGKGRVYLDFLKKIHREVSARGRQMLFWGDILLNYPELIAELPKGVIALDWGYEADHPFPREARGFSEAKVPFYICPGTSTWTTLIGRHDNAFANLRSAARAGRNYGAAGFLITDWGDGGHPQPLAVSYLPFLAGAALSWSGQTYDEKLLIPVLSRDVFNDPTERMAKAALDLGLAHRKFNFYAPNLTPFGAVIAAPPAERRELVCRDGLKYHARIPAKNIQAALDEVERQRALLAKAQPKTRDGEILAAELDLAARMAAQSCKFMLWQQAVAAGKSAAAKALAGAGIRELRDLDRDFSKYWPSRNKGTAENCSPFLSWRIADYQRPSC